MKLKYKKKKIYKKEILTIYLIEMK
jgi:hypothetical protein